MPATFDQTLRALHTDKSRRGWIGLVGAIVLGAAWVIWMTLSKVPVYRTSVHARLEVQPPPTRVATLTAGRVTAVHLQVGARVKAGDPLLELDIATEKVALDRAKSQAAALDPELASIDREIAAEGHAVTAGEASGVAAVGEQYARQDAARANLEHAIEEQKRAAALVESGAGPKADLDRARSDVAVRQAELAALGNAAASASAGARERDAGRRLRVAELERQRAEVSGQISTAQAEVARLQLELEHRTMRAPVDGVLGSISTIQPGAVMAAGDPVATVVPDGVLRVIADYGPTAIGRLATGQHGRVRLDGFPWTRWGTVPVTVSSVANEVRDGVIRVELTIDPGPLKFPLAHGMTGAVDVEIEKASPAALVMRSLIDRSDGSENPSTTPGDSGAGGAGNAAKSSSGAK